MHGFNSSGSIWTTMIGTFKKDGWTDTRLFSWSYDTGQSNATTANLIQQKVDIISHSMGGLTSRYCLTHLAGDARVNVWVSHPNHGPNSADPCWTTSCVEMRQGSTFLPALNSMDETHSTPRYGTRRSPCDVIINWDSSVPPSGATNTRTACLSHSSRYQSNSVYTQVRDFVPR